MCILTIFERFQLTLEQFSISIHFQQCSAEMKFSLGVKLKVHSKHIAWSTFSTLQQAYLERLVRKIAESLPFLKTQVKHRKRTEGLSLFYKTKSSTCKFDKIFLVDNDSDNQYT